MPHFRRRLAQKTVALVGVAAVLFGALGPLLAIQTASALTYSDQTVVDRLKSYDAYTILKMCFVPSPASSNSEMHLVVSAGSGNNMSAWAIADTGADPTKATLPNNMSGSNTRTVHVPAYYDIQNDGNLQSNSVTCAGFFSAYGTYLGISDPAKYLEDAGFTFDGGNIAVFGGCQITGTPSQINQRYSDEFSCLRQAAGNRLGTSTTSTPPWDDQMSYLRNKLILDAKAAGTEPGGCYVHWNTNTTNTATFSISSWLQDEVGRSGDDGILGTQANPTIIQVADNDGKPTKAVSNIAASEGGDGRSGWDKTVYVGPGVASTSVSSLRAAKAKCQDLATDLGMTTARYVAWAKNNTEANNETGTPGENIDAATVEDSCPIESGGMRWLECSIFFALQGTAEKLQEQISKYLYTDPEIFNADTQASAALFRNIGMALIVIAGLVMVISQALGLDLLDAYTIRKLLPKLGIALVGIALAWPLLKLALTLTNDLGQMIHSLFMSLAAQTNPDVSSQDGGTRMGVVFGFLTIAGGVGLAIGALGFLSLFGTIILALLVGVIVLTIRQLVIFTAIILAPLAIAAYVIPGGEKLWKFWKTTLITTLLMYPLIMGFISAGEAMSYIMPKENLSDGATSMSLLAILVYFAPFFMLPFAFKLAGGLMSTIFSFANDKNRGAFDRLKKFRSDKLGKNLTAMKTGNRFRNTSRLGNWFNERSKGAYDATQTFGLTTSARKRRREAYHSNHGFHAAMQIRKDHGDMMMDDGVNNAILESDGSLESIRQNLINGGYNGERLTAALGTAERLMHTGSRQDVMAAVAMANVPTGSGYTDTAHMLKTIARVSGGNTDLAVKMLGTMRGEAKQTGRSDLGGTRFGMQARYLLQEIEHEGGGTNAAAVQDMALSAFSQTDTATIARERTETIRAYATQIPALIEDLKRNPRIVTMDDGTTVNSEDLIGRLTAQMENLTDSAREIGPLDRAHVAHEATEAINDTAHDLEIEATPDFIGPRLPDGRVSPAAPLVGTNGDTVEEHRAHRSRYATDPYDPRNPRNPNRQTPEAPPPPEP